jgi:hypothetical protein
VDLFTAGTRANEIQPSDASWAQIDYHKLKNSGTLVICADITERKQAETELKSAKYRIEEALHESKMLHRRGACLARLAHWLWDCATWSLKSCSEEYAR